MEPSPLKILFASNELVGLGHLRRTLKLAACIQAELVNVSMLILTASDMAHAFPLPKGLDIIQIPGVRRSNENPTTYCPLRLPLAFEDVGKLRAQIIRATASAYHPDLFFVDYRPDGLAGELIPTLRALKRRRQTKLVLILRDILGDPTYVRERWLTDRAMEALTSYYDEIWVFGCQSFYDPIREYNIPAAIARKIRFCGYLDTESSVSLVAAREHILRDFGVSTGPFVLVTIGGSSVGFALLDTYMRALERFPDELNVFSLLVGGPALSKEQREIICRRCDIICSRFSRRRVQFTDFLPDLVDHMAAADVVVSLGGYNTVTEILRLAKRALIVPYKGVHDEQLIRASLLEDFGLVRTIHPGRLSAKNLAENVLDAIRDEPPTRQQLQRLGIHFDGLHRFRIHLTRLLESRDHPPR
jgi:predicted glycosyltransferase